MSCKTWLTQLVPEASRKAQLPRRGRVAGQRHADVRPQRLVNERTSAQRGAPVGSAE